jgi:hypothetical protein
MKTKILWLLAAMTVAGTAAAKAPSCSSIKNDKQRLACFDKAEATASTQIQSAPAEAVAAAAPTPAPVPTPAKQTGDTFVSGSWHVNKKRDAMTDKMDCTALYQGAWKIQGDASTFYVGLKGRGGVSAYKLRIDDDAPDSLKLASDVERRISAADLTYSFGRILNAKRVRIQVQTILDTIVVEDIDMTGFKEAVDYIKSNCQA